MYNNYDYIHVAVLKHDTCGKIVRALSYCILKVHKGSHLQITWLKDVRAQKFPHTDSFKTLTAGRK